MWNLGPENADHEVLNTEVPVGTIFAYIRISGTPGLATCTTPPYQGIGQILCHENGTMAPNTTWTVRLTVKVTAPLRHNHQRECDSDGGYVRSELCQQYGDGERDGAVNRDGGSREP